MNEDNGEKANILLAAIAKKYGPFALEESDIVDNEDGFAVFMRDGLLYVESWDGNEPENQTAE